MSLYRRYRPQDFTTLVGQDFVKESLMHALREEGKIVGAYLFHGSRGTGKTSVARIFAKAMNCDHLLPDGNPCLHCSHCEEFQNGEYLDVVEIDAASNTSVDNVRELIERSRFAPSRGRYKVYIIDEVHMLSKGAFNALLKTLEEPPSHVRFILATTEIYRVPDTIISRVQRYDFRPISEELIHGRLRYIADAESITVDDGSLALLARIAHGGMRDAITLMEQYTISGTLTLATLEENLGFVSDTTIAGLLDALVRDDREGALGYLAGYRGRSIDVRRFVEQIIIMLRDRMVSSLDTPEFARYMRIFEVFHDVYDRLRNTPDPFLLMEIGILRIIHHAPTSVDAIAPPSPVPAPIRPAAIARTPETKTPSTPSTPPPTTPMPAPAEPAPIPHVSQDTSAFDMGRLFEHVKKLPGRSFVAMSLRVCRYEIAGGSLVLFPDNAFNAKKLDVPTVKSFLADEIRALWGLEIGVRIEIGSGGREMPAPPPSLADSAEDIF